MAYRSVTLSRTLEVLVQRNCLPRVLMGQRCSLVGCCKSRRLHSTTSLSKVVQEWRRFCSKPPKGFEKFFKGRNKEAPKSKSSQSTKPKEVKEPEKPPPSRASTGSSSRSSENKTDNIWNSYFGSNSGGTPKGRKPIDDKERQQLIYSVLATAAGAAFISYFMFGGSAVEITWKQFAQEYLPKGS
uniref:AFG3-like protein 2-like n=1 Tax=Saccoglossus kowalevskii TaxID=10224 RepID=A0ABM0H1H5_SACKO